MSQYQTHYPKLKYFFSGYFHQDWVESYDWQDGEPSFQVVVYDFRDNEYKPTVDQTTQELEQFLDFVIRQDLMEADLREIVVRKLGANIYPPADNLTYRQWLQAVLDTLRESIMS